MASSTPPASVARLSFSSGTLLLEGMTAAGVARVFQRVSWVYDPRVTGWRCDALEYDVVRSELAARCTAFEDLVTEPEPVRWPRVSLPELRPEQRAACAAWNKTGRGVVVMPTGTGKTEVALSLMVQTEVSTLVVAPVRDLMYQWHRRIAAGLGCDAGVVGDGIHRVKAVCVTTYDSACIHMHRLGARFGLIVFDECHHLPGPVRADAARMCAATLRLGLTATLERSDGRHHELNRLIGPVVYALPVSEVRGRTLADYDVVRIPVHLSDNEQRSYDRLSEDVRRYMYAQRKSDPKFTWQTLCTETRTDPAARRALKSFYAKKAVEDRAEEKLRVLEDLFRLHAGEPVIVFAGSNAMARDVSLRFLVPCLLSHSGRRERREVLDGFENGTYPVLVANRVLDEGVDLPEVKTAVVIGGMASTRQAKQRLGRVLRKSGNARAVLYEVVCAGTNEEQRSRKRRKSDAFEKVRRLS